MFSLPFQGVFSIVYWSNIFLVGRKIIFCREEKRFESDQMGQRVGSNGAMSRLNIISATWFFTFSEAPDFIQNESRRHPEGIPKDCSNKFLQKTFLHSFGMTPKLLRTPYHPYPRSLTQSAQLTPKVLITPSQSSLIILPNPSQLPPNFLPTFSPTFSPKMASKKGGANKQTGARLLPQISFFTHKKKHFCGELW